MRVAGRVVAIAATTVMFVGVFAGSAQAITATARTTGSEMGANFTFVTSGKFTSSSIDVYDTACDGHAVNGRFQSVDAYGDTWSYAAHVNAAGCGTSVRWSNLTGSNAYGIQKLRIRVHTNGTSNTGYSSWSQNPKWG